MFRYPACSCNDQCDSDGHDRIHGNTLLCVSDSYCNPYWSGRWYFQFNTHGLVIDAITGNIDLAASTAGPYTVIYTFIKEPAAAVHDINQYCCYQSNLVVINNPAAVCAPATVDITAATVTAGSTAGLTYTYFTDAAGTIALATPNAVAASGTYYIKGSTVSGCSDIQPVVVTINAKPTVVITNPAAVCAPGNSRYYSCSCYCRIDSGPNVHLLHRCRRHDCSGNTERSSSKRNLLYQGNNCGRMFRYPTCCCND